MATSIILDAGNQRVQIFESNGLFYGDLPLDYPEAEFVDIVSARNQSLYVADQVNGMVYRLSGYGGGISRWRVVIVAGGGPYTGNTLWDATQVCANYAYRVLTYQGFTKDTIII